MMRVCRSSRIWSGENSLLAPRWLYIVVDVFLRVEVGYTFSVHNLSSRSNIQPRLGIKLLTCIYIWTWVPVTYAC